MIVDTLGAKDKIIECGDADIFFHDIKKLY